MRTLRLGSAGQHVEMLQLALVRYGFSLDTDGIFGYRTQNALSSFQKANGLLADGIAGMMTWNRLKPYLTGYEVHRVMRGETFWQLAEHYNTSVNAIRVANPTLNPLSVPIGASVVIPLGFPVVSTTISYSSDLVAFQVEGLVMRYPFITSSVYGSSYAGKELLSMTLGSGRKQLLYNASHHANEWITTPVLMKYVEELAFSFAYSGRIYGESAKELLSQIKLTVVPLVNPDGVDLVTGAFEKTSQYLKQTAAIASNYPEIPYPDGWKANIIGTDLNLNYPAEWERAKEIKYALGFTAPAPRDYVGSAPLSAPESLAMYNLTRENNFLLTLSYHTQGEVIFWKYLDFEPEYSRQIGEVFARESGYLLSLTPPESSYAGYKDWFISEYNLPGYTVEVGLGENPLSIEQFSEIYADNIGILTLAMKLTYQLL